MKQDVKARVQRIMTTRIGSRPGNPTYGSRVYLLRDRPFNDETKVWFAKYTHEDIQRSDETLVVTEAKLLSLSRDRLKATVTVRDAEPLQIEVPL